MSAPDDGGPAFPCEGGDMSGLRAHPGMTLRDYFAAKAIEGLLACPTGTMVDNGISTEKEGVTATAYYLADLMLRARAAKTEGT